jgi:hypothetical protein
MTHLHPVMQAALAPFMPQLTKSDNTEGYSPGADDLRGLYQYRFETSMGLVIQCYLEHQTAEEATDVCPPIDERMELIWACVGGIDISEVLTDIAPVIEAEALESLSEVQS